MMLKSRASNSSDFWNCCICHKFSSYHLKGIRVHITQIHCLKVPKKDRVRPKRVKIDETGRHERDREWVKKKIVESEAPGEIKSWNCCICNNFSSQSYSGINAHIFQLHCVKKVKRQRIALANVEGMERHERDLVWINEMIKKSQLDGGKGWICCLCKGLKTQFFSGIKSHIIFVHCVKGLKGESLKEPRRPAEEADKYERHERDIEWVREQVEKSKLDGSSEWACCLCNDFTSRFTSGIRSHILLRHCVKAPKTEMNETEVETIDDSDKHDRDPKWINEMIENSKVPYANEWTCRLCGNYTGTSVKGIQQHITIVHCKKDKFVVIKSILEPEVIIDESDRHERDPEWIKEMVEESKASDGSNNWYCCVCNNFSTGSHTGIRIHIDRIHCKAPPKTNLDASTCNDDDDKFIKGDTVESGIRNDWIRNVIEENESNWTCSLCKETFESFKEIKTHVTRTHRRELDVGTRDKIKEEYDKMDVEDIKERILKCRLKAKTLDGSREIWSCAKCDSKVFYTYEDIYQHIKVKHMSMKSETDAEKERQLSESDNEWLPSSIRIRSARCSGYAARVQTNIPDKYKFAMELKYQPTVVLQHLVMPITSKGSINHQNEDNCESELDDKAEEIRGKRTTVSEMTVSELRWLRFGIQRSKSSSEKSWMCWICKQIYKSNSSIRYHILAYHLPYLRLGNEQFKAHSNSCKVDKLVPYRDRTKRIKRIQHQMLKNKTGPKTKPRRCTSCDFQFSKRHIYRAHLKIHIFTDPVVTKTTLLKCDLCSLTFRDLEDLTAHKNFHETSGASVLIQAEPFKFSLFNSKSAITHHEEKETFEFSCGHCGRKYRSDLDIKRHIAFQHHNPLLCPLDNQTFGKLHDFINHVNTDHLDLRKIANTESDEHDISSKRFSDKEELLQPEQELQRKQFSCNRCDDVFSGEEDLKSHMRVHIKVSEICVLLNY